MADYLIVVFLAMSQDLNQLAFEPCYLVKFKHR